MLWVLIRSASPKTYVVGTHLKRLTEALLMSTHNICFCREVRKILYGYPLLSVAMVMGTYKKFLSEVLLLSTHNMCFWGEIRKLLLLSGAM